MPDEIHATLNLEETDIPGLPAPVRQSLLSFLLRWKHYDAAELCLQRLLTSHRHLVSVYDSTARLYLAREENEHALEMIKRRNAIRASNTSRALEARIHLAEGDLSSAQAILDLSLIHI